MEREWKWCVSPPSWVCFLHSTLSLSSNPGVTCWRCLHHRTERARIPESVLRGQLPDQEGTSILNAAWERIQDCVMTLYLGRFCWSSSSTLTRWWKLKKYRWTFSWDPGSSGKMEEEHRKKKAQEQRQQNLRWGGMSSFPGSAPLKYLLLKNQLIGLKQCELRWTTWIFIRSTLYNDIHIAQKITNNLCHTEKGKLAVIRWLGSMLQILKK